jgi:hypothetical protein
MNPTPTNLPDQKPVSEDAAPPVNNPVSGPDVLSATGDDPKPVTENMETHAHHLHHAPGKKFWHYFYEFLMLFLAVFCGFLAEDQREHMVERRREKQYMRSLTRDLILDTAYLNLIYQLKITRALSIDSTLKYFKNQPGSRELTPELWRMITKNGNDRVFVQHNGTIDQLKNSDGMRLVQKRNIVDSIEAYYQQVTRMEGVQRALFLQFSDDWAHLSGKLVNAFDRIERLKLDSNQQDNWTSDRALLTTNQTNIRINREYLNEFLNYLVIQRSFTITTDMVTNRLLYSKAAELISLIKKEYELE